MATKRMALSIRIYRALLLLYPADYRRAYRALMVQVFRDQCHTAGEQGVPAWLGLWWRTLADALTTIVVEHLDARKVRAMQSFSFKNCPDRLTGLLFLIPGLLLSIFYVLTIYSGESMGYMFAGLVGAAGFGLGFVKIFRRVKIWEQFFLGFAIGGVSFLVAIIASPVANLGIAALRSPPWPTVRSILAVVVCVGIIWLFGRLIERSRRLYWTAAAILLANGLIWAILQVGPNETNRYLWDLNWMWGYSAAILGAVVLGIRLSRKSGLPALLAVIVALGAITSIYLTMTDVAEGKTPFGQIMLLLAYLFPLVICPAWLLFAPTWRGKKYGVLLSWGVMSVAMVLVMPILDSFLEPHYFKYVPPVYVVGSIVTYSPLFLGLWLAFTLYEKQSIESQRDNTPQDKSGMVHLTAEL